MPTACRLVDATGRLFNGDELLYLMAADRLARDEDVPGVVGTLMTNMAVEVALQGHAACSSCAPRSATATCSKSWSKHGWLLGGEGSGHLLALDKHTTGDGLISRAAGAAGLRAQRQDAWPQLLADVTLFPQTLINVRLQPGQDWKTNTALADRDQGGGGRTGRHRPGADPRQRHRAAGAGDGGGARRRRRPRPAPSGWRRRSGIERSPYCNRG